MGDTGLEHPALTPSKPPISATPRTESGTVDDRPCQEDPDLAYVARYWPKLPTHIKAAIKTLAETEAAEQFPGSKPDK